MTCGSVLKQQWGGLPVRPPGRRKVNQSTHHWARVSPYSTHTPTTCARLTEVATWYKRKAPTFGWHPNMSTWSTQPTTQSAGAMDLWPDLERTNVRLFRQRRADSKEQLHHVLFSCFVTPIYSSIYRTCFQYTFLISIQFWGNCNCM